jgi:hypothetical protein
MDTGLFWALVVICFFTCQRMREERAYRRLIATHAAQRALTGERNRLGRETLRLARIEPADRASSASCPTVASTVPRGSDAPTVDYSTPYGFDEERSNDTFDELPLDAIDADAARAAVTEVTP